LSVFFGDVGQRGAPGTSDVKKRDADNKKQGRLSKIGDSPAIPGSGPTRGFHLNPPKFGISTQTSEGGRTRKSRRTHGQSKIPWGDISGGNEKRLPPPGQSKDRADENRRPKGGELPNQKLKNGGE